MKKIETVIYHIVGLILIYLALAALRYILSFMLRYWILLIVLVAAIYFIYRRCMHVNEPWWWIKIKAFLLRVKRKGEA